MIKKLRNDYQNGILDIKEYGSQMFACHENLLAYCDLLQDSAVESIAINHKHVVIEIKTGQQCIKMILHPTDVAQVPSTVLSLGSYEQEELNMCLRLANMLRDDSVFFDIGANLGWYTLNILKNTSIKSVFSFEPISETMQKMRENMRINNEDDDRCFCFGFSNQNKTDTFFYDVLASGASSLADLRELPTTKKVKCALKTVDGFVKEHALQRLDFIKCDVEGAEKFVYEGALESLRNFKPIVFSEMLRKWSAKFEYHPNDIIFLFRNLGYECYTLSKNNLQKFHLVSESTVETNYFFLHTYAHADIIRQLVRENNC